MASNGSVQFSYSLAEFIAFRDAEACARVRTIRRSELADHPVPGSTSA